MPWTGRLYKPTTAGYINRAAAIDPLYLHWEVLCLFLWIFISLQTGMVQRGTAFNWDLRELGLA